ncbi:uncharacterized protein isoform X2 [Leptinotarsa decemlineata]
MFANLQKNRLKKEAVPTGFSDEINPSEQDNPVVDDTGMSNISESVAGTSQGRQTYEDVQLIMSVAERQELFLLPIHQPKNAKDY